MGPVDGLDSLGTRPAGNRQPARLAVRATPTRLTNAVIVVLALIGIDVVISLVKQRSPTIDRVLEGLPVVMVDAGVPRLELMKRLRVDVADVPAAARERQGLERLDQIKYAVLERSGGILGVPHRDP